MYEELKEQAKKTTEEICDKAGLKEGNILVVGCSSSEICGDKIGSNSNLEVAKAVFSGIYEVLESRKIYLAAQCCEHLNRAIIVERAAVPFSEIVNVVPQPKAGGYLEQQHIRHLKILLLWKKLRQMEELTLAELLLECTLRKLQFR